MNQLYLYLYPDVLAQEPSSDDAKPVVIGDFDTREPAKREDDADSHPLSFI
ncbi:MAG TPA: hypothetical protein VJ484_08715 [Lysobacter sp.]|nr:hypothetical protein [Lysobacter sp.]